jgi:Rrf2 family nitric oxide-sensitive transcriptional repressor
MQLTRFTDYSLRVLMFLVVRPGTLARIDEIAETYDISRGHVMKVVRALSQHGYVESVRGRSGGIRLSRPACEIRLGEVVRKTEANLAIVECFGADGICRIESACGLQAALTSALDAFLAVLDEYTLDDLVERPRVMARLLQIG